MITIEEQLRETSQAKAAQKAALERRGINMEDVPFIEYGDKIDSIEGEEKKYTGSIDRIGLSVLG